MMVGKFFASLFFALAIFILGSLPIMFMVDHPSPPADGMGASLACWGGLGALPFVLGVFLWGEKWRLLGVGVALLVLAGYAVLLICAISLVQNSPQTMDSLDSEGRQLYSSFQVKREPILAIAGVAVVGGILLWVGIDQVRAKSTRVIRR